MAAPRYEIIKKSIQNPHASGPLIIPIVVLCNTSDEQLAKNVRTNSLRDLKWLQLQPTNGKMAILIGGGPSAAEQVDKIKALHGATGVVFAMNGASKWAREHGIRVDYQVLSDAKPETASLVDREAKAHLIASQCDPATVEAVENPLLWHLEIGDVEKNFIDIWKARKPELKRGGYALIGGGCTTGICSMCVAYVMGFRAFHVFGFDSSHKDNNSHAYPQPMNDLIPTVEVEWAGKTYTCSVAMKAQAEKFQITAQALKQEGCEVKTYGDGLLQH